MKTEEQIEYLTDCVYNLEDKYKSLWFLGACFIFAFLCLCLWLQLEIDSIGSKLSAMPHWECHNETSYTNLPYPSLVLLDKALSANSSIICPKNAKYEVGDGRVIIKADGCQLMETKQVCEVK